LPVPQDSHKHHHPLTPQFENVLNLSWINYLMQYLNGAQKLSILSVTSFIALLGVKFSIMPRVTFVIVILGVAFFKVMLSITSFIVILCHLQPKS
jgi:hypothetical protein